MFRRMLVSVLAAVSAVSAVSLVAAPPVGADAAEDATALASKLNSLRGLRGLAPLATRSDLSALALSWSRHMSGVDAISHNAGLATDGPHGWHRLGENVGRGGDVQGLHDAFVASPTHYRNMVDPGFELTGVGVVWRDDGTRFVTVLFMEVVPSGPQPAVASAPEVRSPPRERPAPVARRRDPSTASAAPVPAVPAVPVVPPVPPVGVVPEALVPPLGAAPGPRCTGIGWVRMLCSAVGVGDHGDQPSLASGTWDSLLGGWLDGLPVKPGWLGRILHGVSTTPLSAPVIGRPSSRRFTALGWFALGFVVAAPAL